MNVAKMAWRNVTRNRRRSGITIVAMSLGLLVMVLFSGLIEGYLADMERHVVDMEVGDIQIHAEGYLEKPSLFTRIDDSSALVEALEAAGFNASPRLLGGALAGAGDSSAGVLLKGLDVARDAEVCAVHEAVERGEWLDSDAPKGLVIGWRLAKTLDVSIGDEVALLTQAADGSSADDLFVVRGILKTVADITDRRTIFMTEASFRELIVMPTGAHEILIRRPRTRDLESAAISVRALAEGYDVKTWKELMPTVAGMLASTRSLMVVIFVIIYLAIAILVLNAMLMAVFERIREFGVFKAIGGSPLRVLTLVLCESMIQIGVSIGIGLSLAVPGMWYLAEYGVNVGRVAGVSIAGVAMQPIWKGIYTPSTVAVPVLVLAVMAFSAAFYPALKAAWIRPVEAMRHQ